MIELGELTIREYNQMCKTRDPYKSFWKVISKYLLMRDITFGDESTPGAPPNFHVKNVSDDEVVEAAQTAATALGGALWPHAGDSFELIPDTPQNSIVGDEYLYGTNDNKKYCENATNILRKDFDSPDTRFLLAWSEHLDDQPTFGTSGLYGVEHEDDDRTPYSFRSVSVTRCVFAEDVKGNVNRVGLELAYTINQLAEEYGIENCSERIQQIYKEGDPAQCDQYVKVVQMIKPRKKGRKGNNVPVTERAWATVHVEVETKKVLLESGNNDLSVWMCRFRKLTDEIYGRSLAMSAIPTVRELNSLRLNFSKSLEKVLRPPIGYFTEAIGGNGQPDLSAGATIPLVGGTRLPDGTKPIEILYQLSEPRVASERLQELVLRVKSKMLIDRLLDFNNRVRMTAREVDKRDGFRNQALNNIFQRQMNEILVPAIKWAYFVRYRRGLIGLHPVRDLPAIQAMQAQNITPLVVPQPLADLLDKGIFPFTIRFISPAARAMKQESLDGADRFTNFGIALAGAGVPGAMDVIEEEDSMRIYADLCGAPSAMVRSKQDVKKIRNARAQAAQKDQGIGDAQAQAEIAQKSGNAFASFQRGMNG